MPTAERVPSQGHTSDGSPDCSTLNDTVACPAQQNDMPPSTTADNEPSEAKRSYVNAGTFFQSMLGDDDKIELLQDLTGPNPCGVGTITEGPDGELTGVPPSHKRDLRTGLPTSIAAFDSSPPKPGDDQMSHTQASGQGSHTPSAPSRTGSEAFDDEERGRPRRMTRRPLILPPVWRATNFHSSQPPFNDVHPALKAQDRPPRLLGRARVAIRRLQCSIQRGNPAHKRPMHVTPSIPSLKRPRSTDPPSPSSTSSPKRAASEDPYATSSDSGRLDGQGLLSPSMAPGPAGSSPLRYENEDDGASSPTEGWVSRTEGVHLGEEDSSSKQEYKQQYDELLQSFPPPYRIGCTYYVFPKRLFSTLQTLALAEAGSSKETVSPADLKIDLSDLLADPTGVEVISSYTLPRTDAPLKSEPNGVKTRLWPMKDGLLEQEDFLFVSASGWGRLCEWFGPHDGPVLPRLCSNGERIILKPPIYKLYITLSPGTPSSIPTAAPILFTHPPFFKVSTFVTFVRKLASSYAENFSPSRAWRLDITSRDTHDQTLPALSSIRLPYTLLPSLSGELLNDPIEAEKSCEEAGFVDGDCFTVEIGKMDPLGGMVWSVDVNEELKAVEKVAGPITVPSAPPPLFSKPGMFSGFGTPATSSEAESSSAQGVMQTRSQTSKEARKGKGLVGLQNLGNTCFMNSAVQCLSNTRELSEYFLAGVYREELNPDNPLGMQGQVAESFGGVIEALWAPSSGHSSFSPRQLKWTTSRFAPQFAGYGQHDTQEFIAFLLDGLHEDLNRIKKKPYIEKPDWKPGGGDVQLAELGRECWDGYKKRNDSVIVDLFQGQLQSTLVCPECHKESITMDPFMYLTVPLPIAQFRQLKLKFIPKDVDRPPVRVRLLVPQNSSFMQVKEKLGQLMKAKSSNMVCYDLWKSNVYQWWLDADHNSDFKDSDEGVFHELSVPVSAGRKGVGVPLSETSSVTVPVFTYRSEGGNSPRDLPSECSLQPFFITLNRVEATDPAAVREAIIRGYSQFVRPEMKTAMWVPPSSQHAAVPQNVSEDEEPVTEIHLEGSQTRLVEVSSRSDGSTLDLDVTQASTDSTLIPPASVVALPTNASSASLVSLASAGSLVPRGDLFKINVTDAATGDKSSGFNPFKGKPDVIPFYKQTISAASQEWSPLEHRKKARKNMLGRLTSGFNSFVNPAYNSDDESSPPSTPPNTPFVVRPGEGIYCEWTHKKFTEFFDTAWQPEEVIDPAIQREAEKKKAGKAINIEDCLDEFSKEETLGQDDLWYCPQCKKHQAATKKLEIYKAPDILVICIKRFGSSRRLSDKLDHLVHFPVDGLDLEARIGERRVARSLNLSSEQAKEYGMEPLDESLVYDLYAVDNHFGGMGGGHYTAFCRNRVDGAWYNYDDSRVSKANVESVQSRAAYLLFYRRRASRPIGGISRVKAEEAEASRATSRAQSPSPPSPAEAGPSNLRKAAVVDSSDEAVSSDGELPSYSASGSPAVPSPTLSSEDEGTRPARDASAFNTVGSSIGYGNTAWGSRSNDSGVGYGFGQLTTTTATSTSGEEIDVPSGLPSPPESEDGAPTTAKPTMLSSGGEEADSRTSSGEEGLGERYGMVKRPAGADRTDIDMSSR